jgi:hypothetical protein
MSILSSDFDSLAFVPASQNTRPAYPLGRPVDGRLRFGMTPEQAFLYRSLVAEVEDEYASFSINTRLYAKRLHRTSHSHIFRHIEHLIERGWIMVSGYGRFKFVHPVMRFKPHGSTPKQNYSISTEVPEKRSFANLQQARPNSKLTITQVHAIRRSKNTARQIAAEFGVSHKTVGKIRSRNIWKWVPDET